MTKRKTKPSSFSLTLRDGIYEHNPGKFHSWRRNKDLGKFGAASAVRKIDPKAWKGGVNGK